MSTGCNEFLGDNVSPNSPSATTLPALLSVVEVSTMNTYNGDLARIPNMWTQHTAGTLEQYQAYGEYNINEGDVNNQFKQIYAGSLINARDLIALAGDNNPWYRGIGRVLMAMNYGLATDFWGDQPFNEALQGDQDGGELSPHYDAQSVVIAGIQTLLDDAIVDLSAAEADNVNLPGSDDFIHGGDVTKWIKTAYILKARYHIRLTKKDAVTSSNDALNALNLAGLTGTSDDANGQYGPNSLEYNQWYAFYIQRQNYHKMSEFFIDMLQTTNDPRLPFFATTDTGGVYRGTPNGSLDISTSDVGDYFASANSICPLVTYVEAKFIEAEARFRTGDLNGAATAHNTAIIAHLNLVTGSADPTYVTNHASETAGTITLDKIMTQKYIAMFTQPETWADWRRTNIPALTPNPNGVISSIPRRFPTALDERVTNSNATVETDITAPVWWDL